MKSLVLALILLIPTWVYSEEAFQGDQEKVWFVPDLPFTYNYFADCSLTSYIKVTRLANVIEGRTYLYIDIYHDGREADNEENILLRRVVFKLSKSLTDVDISPALKMPTVIFGSTHGKPCQIILN